MNVTENDTVRIFDKLDAIEAGVGRVHTDVAVLKAEAPATRSRLEDHEKRLRSIEVRLWAAVGALGLLTFVLNYIPLPTP